MPQEIQYTSAPAGLKPGSRGFCTVASTAGLPKHLSEQLEALSGYRHVFPPQHPQAALNPPVYMHLRLGLVGRTYHVLSRIGDAGLDYTQRNNKFAHHVSLDPSELPAAGPAAVLAAPGFMQRSWQGEPRVTAGRNVPQLPAGPQIARGWQQIAGDAGWAGVLAETAYSVTAQTRRQAVLIFTPGQDCLALLVEALSLLPPAERWGVTFSTYYTKLPPGIDCRWRCVLAGSSEAATVQRTPAVLVLDLTSPLGPAAGGPLVAAARKGQVDWPAAPAALPTGPIQVRKAASPTLASSAAAIAPAAAPAADELEQALADEQAAVVTETGAPVPLRAGPPPRRRDLPASPSGSKAGTETIWRYAAIGGVLGCVVLAVGVISLLTARTPVEAIAATPGAGETPAEKTTEKGAASLPPTTGEPADVKKPPPPVEPMPAPKGDSEPPPEPTGPVPPPAKGPSEPPIPSPEPATAIAQEREVVALELPREMTPDWTPFRRTLHEVPSLAVKSGELLPANCAFDVRGHETEKGRWTIVVQAPDVDPKVLAELRYHDRDIEFRWATSPTDEYPKLLRNCILDVTTTRSLSRLKLRTPITLPKLRITSIRSTPVSKDETFDGFPRHLGPDANHWPAALCGMDVRVSGNFGSGVLAQWDGKTSPPTVRVRSTTSFAQPIGPDFQILLERKKGLAFRLQFVGFERPIDAPPVWPLNLEWARVTHSMVQGYVEHLERDKNHFLALRESFRDPRHAVRLAEADAKIEELSERISKWRGATLGFKELEQLQTQSRFIELDYDFYFRIDGEKVIVAATDKTPVSTGPRSDLDR